MKVDLNSSKRQKLMVNNSNFRNSQLDNFRKDIEIFYILIKYGSKKYIQ